MPQETNPVGGLETDDGGKYTPPKRRQQLFVSSIRLHIPKHTSRHQQRHKSLIPRNENVIAALVMKFAPATLSLFYTIYNTVLVRL
jgi:hypothetical protein